MNAQPSDRRNRVAALFESGAYFQKEFHIELRARLVRQMLGNVEGKRLLDLGCGDGRISLQFADQASSLTLVDPSREMLRRARERVQSSSAHIRLVPQSIEDMDQQSPCDVVLCLGVLAHVDDVERAVRRVAGLVAPGGRCIVQITDAGTFPGRSVLASQSFRWSYRLRSITAHRLEQSFQRHGLVLRARRGYFLSIPGLGLLPNRILMELGLLLSRYEILQPMASEFMLLFERSC